MKVHRVSPCQMSHKPIWWMRSKVCRTLWRCSDWNHARKLYKVCIEAWQSTVCFCMKCHTNPTNEREQFFVKPSGYAQQWLEPYQNYFFTAEARFFLTTVLMTVKVTMMMHVCVKQTRFPSSWGKSWGVFQHLQSEKLPDYNQKQNNSLILHECKTSNEKYRISTHWQPLTFL